MMPQLGETVAEGKITKWFKAAGDKVAPGDNLFEIETDKVSTEVPATEPGGLTEVGVATGGRGRGGGDRAGRRRGGGDFRQRRRREADARKTRSPASGRNAGSARARSGDARADRSGRICSPAAASRRA